MSCEARPERREGRGDASPLSARSLPIVRRIPAVPEPEPDTHPNGYYLLMCANNVTENGGRWHGPDYDD